MRYLVDVDKPSLEELTLQHFGVKGMKWGVIREKVGTSVSNKIADVKRNHQLNKEFNKGERAKDNARIDAARERFNSGQARKDYLDAKAQYKVDKKEIGTAAARAKFNAVKERNMNDGDVAALTKHGKEKTIAVMALVGLTALRVGLAVAASRR